MTMNAIKAGFSRPHIADFPGSVRDWIASALPKSPKRLDEPHLVPAAVLVPIVMRDGAPRLVLTRRTMTVATHKGQISFPGGHVEPQDDGPVATALREANEEIGLPPDKVEVLGLLDDSSTITRFIITPVVALVDSRARLTVDPREVDIIIEVSLHDLLTPQNHRLCDLTHQGTVFTYHRYDIAGHNIWGATAGIIHRLISRLDKIPALLAPRRGI